VDRVVARAAIDQVRGDIRDDIAPAAAVELVAVRSAVEEVVTQSAEQLIVARGPQERVVAGGAIQNVVGRFPCLLNTRDLGCHGIPPLWFGS
jgi:hypothetical protein